MQGVNSLPPERFDWSEEGSEPRKPRRWQDKFGESFRGVKRGIRSQSSFFVHFFFAALAVTFAMALDCNLVEWCLIFFCIGGVLTAELFNSAIETLFHGLDEATKSRWNGCLEIASGAVLVASLTAVLVGVIIFGNRLRMLF